MSEKPKRRWYQFSLKAMLIGMTVAAILLALTARKGGRQGSGVLSPTLQHLPQISPSREP